MRYERRPGDGAGLVVLALGALLGLAAAALVGRAPDLWQAARWDGPNFAFLLLAVGALGAVGNGFWILGTHRIAFAGRWWLFALAAGFVLGGVTLGFGWSMPLVLVAIGGAVMAALEVVELFALPVELGHGLLKLTHLILGPASGHRKREDA